MFSPYNTIFFPICCMISISNMISFFLLYFPLLFYLFVLLSLIFLFFLFQCSMMIYFSSFLDSYLLSVSSYLLFIVEEDIWKNLSVSALRTQLSHFNTFAGQEAFQKQDGSWVRVPDFCSLILDCTILFHFILFYLIFVLYCFISLYSLLMYFNLFYFTLFHFILFCISLLQPIPIEILDCLWR